MGFATRKQPKPVRPELVEGPFFPLHGLDDLLGLYDALPGRGFLHRTYGQSFASCCPACVRDDSGLTGRQIACNPKVACGVLSAGLGAGGRTPNEGMAACPT